MKRDDDLLRNLLFEFEKDDDWLVLFPATISMPKEDRRKLGHIQLLCDAGLVSAVGKGSFRLTNAGHDYLEAIRSENVWNMTKSGAAAVGGMTLEMMKDLAVAYLKKEAADKLGVSL